MPATDLDYFCERDMDRTNIKDFYESLPSKLQSKFKKCIHVKIMWENVLQGYRGPSNLRNGGSGDSEQLKPSNGIQEIKFWWGARKDLNVLPIIGTFTFFGGRLVQSIQGQLDWSSLYFDSKTGECLSHDKDEASEKLNERGCQLFNEGKYSEAAEYHKNACKSCSFWSRNVQNVQTFKNNLDKAESEIDAINLNSQGDRLFRQGKYSEAYSKYREAYHKSQVPTQYGKYRANRDKAQIQNKLSILRTLWNKAWDAENDTENDRSGEAKDTFEKVLSESKDSFKIFPDNLRFKQYETLVSLKIEGNQLFNRGVESQQDGTKCLQEAQELRQQQKFKLALIKYQDAKDKFCDAQKKFAIGSETDQRFLSCIEFVQEQLNEVIESIEIAKSHTLNQGLNDLNINISSDNLNTNADESNITTTEGHHNYFQQI